jgi:hypothetical protein
MYPQLTYFYYKKRIFNFNILIKYLSNYYTDYYTVVMECVMINYCDVVGDTFCLRLCFKLILPSSAGHEERGAQH